MIKNKQTVHFVCDIDGGGLIFIEYDNDEYV